MSNYPIQRSLDPYHARIGYLGAFALVATRGLDRREALMARYEQLLYERIFRDDERWDLLLSRVDESRRPELMKRMRRREEEDPTASFAAGTSQVEAPPQDWLLTAGNQKRPLPKLVDTDWLYISEFWLYDERMPAALGFLPRERADRTLDLANWTSVLLPTLELSENGYLLHHFLAKAAKESGDEAFNVLHPSAHPALPALYFRVLLESEILFPYLVNEFVERQGKAPGLATRGAHGLLLGAVNRMLETVGDVADPENIMEVRRLTDFRSAIYASDRGEFDKFDTESARKNSKDSTQENYLRPRMEILVDLGLIGRKSRSKEGKRSEFMWDVTATTRLLADELRPLMTQKNTVREYLDTRFFESWTRIHGGRPRKAQSTDEVLLWFARAFSELGREFGFTPGRTVALKACLAAWQTGTTIEVKEVFNAVYEAARSRWGDYLKFSGGSRFDSEFLIRMDDAMLNELERENKAK